MDDRDANLTVEPADDIEFEVSPLHTSALEDEPHADKQRDSRRRPMRASPPGARLSRVRRSLAGAVALTSTVLAIVILAVSIPSAGDSIRVALHLPTPSPTATPPRGSDMLFLAHTVPWGQLRVDGRSLDDLRTRIDLIDGYPAIRLKPGAHTLTYAADQFPTVTCAVGIPVSAPPSSPAAARSCGFLPFPSDRPPSSAPAAHLVDLQATLDRLSPATISQMKEEISATLPSAQTVVQLGERYLGPDGVVRVAATALPAQLVMRLNSDPSVALPLGDFPTKCAILCADLIQSATPTQSPVWALFANVIPVWRFGAAGSEVSAPFVPPADVPADVVTQLVTVGLVYDQGRLRVMPRGSDSASHLVFSAATNALSGFGQKLTAQYPSGWSALPFMARNPADGCMILVGATQPPGGFPSGKTLNVLYQFGVLLAANQMAHDVLPDLPVASAADLDRWRAVS
jgi:hypothetical protein